MFLYLRTKGRVEEAVHKLGYEMLTIHRPGFLLNRDDARLGEKVFSKIPFMKKIEAKEMGKAMIE
jgi:uncharacterized protein YbjT (DUF2867 family)